MCTAATYKTRDFYFGELLIMNFPTATKLLLLQETTHSISVTLIRFWIDTMQSSVWLIFPVAIHSTTMRSMKKDSAWPD